MKKIIFSIFLISSFSQLFAEGPGMQFLHGTSWQKILGKAKAENKYIFVDCFATWCGPCKQMAAAVFPLQEVGDFYNAHYINVKAQMDSSAKDDEEVKARYADNHMILTKYGITAYPTYLIFNPDGELVQRFTGSMPVADFITNGKDALVPENQYYTQMRKYENGERSPAFLYKLAILALKAREPRKGNLVFNDYLKTQADLFTKDNLELIQGYTRSSKDTGFSLMIHSPEKVDAQLGANKAEMTAMYIIMNEEIPNFYKNPPDTLAVSPDWNKLQATIALKYPSNAKMAVENSKIFFYEYNKQWKAYGNAASDYMRDFGSKLRYEQINQYAWNIYQYCNDPKLIGLATEWSKESFASNNDCACIDTYAHLLMKSGKKTEAIEWETKALALAKNQQGVDIGEYEKALQEMKSN